MAGYEAAVAAPGDVEALRAYRDVLAAQSDARADTVTGLLAALAGDGSKLVRDDSPWGLSLGIAMACDLHEEGELASLPELLPVTRMGVELLVGGPVSGRTRFFGDPDLPADFDWPRHRDCKMYFDLDEVDPDLLCRFVCQLDLADFRGPGLPHLDGLLSVFIFQEYEEYGGAGVLVRHFPPGTALETRAHPACDEANARQPPMGAARRPVRMLPGRWGPWEPLAEAHEDAWDVAWEALPSHTHGVFGHLRDTSGDDPTPTSSHHRLLVVPCDDEGVLNVHVAIHQDALSAGRFDAYEVVWVDFDGL